MPIRFAGGEPIAQLEVGVEWANGLHQVDSPAFDRDGNLYATFSGTRGQQVPVSVFRVRPGGTPRAGRVRHRERDVARVRHLRRPVRHQPVRRGGLPHRARRGGREDRIRPRRRVRPGVRARRDDVRRRPNGHAVQGERRGPRRALRHPAAERRGVSPGGGSRGRGLRERADAFVPRPGLPRRSQGRGHASIAEGFGRPQGLAVDAEGTLHVADSLAGASGIFRVVPGRPRELVVAGDGVVGLAFHPARGVAVASGEPSTDSTCGRVPACARRHVIARDQVPARRCAGDRRPLCSSSNASPSRTCSSTTNGPTR